MITLLVMTDGRKEYIKQTIPSALAQLKGSITKRVIHDDSGDGRYNSWLKLTFPTFEVIRSPGRSGFGGAIRNAWAWLEDFDDNPFIFHLEDDFTFNEEIYLDDFIDVLNCCPNIYQMALKRQPWSEAEHIAGGFMELDPTSYRERTFWIEQRKFFTTNPCIYRRSLLDIGWPEGVESEGRFTHYILRTDIEAQFAYWGKKADPPKVTHIGNNRNGIGY